MLLVEDNELNVDMLKRRLERRGFVVRVARDGAEGVAAATADPPDLILMDISLPVMDGWEATRALKADPRTAGVPVLALTAHAMETDRLRSREVGCSEFDTKPVDLERLVGKIRALLGPEVTP